MTYWCNWCNSMTFPWLSMTTVIFQDFPGLNSMNFHDFSGCLWPTKVLYTVIVSSTLSLRLGLRFCVSAMWLKIHQSERTCSVERRQQRAEEHATGWSQVLRAQPVRCRRNQTMKWCSREGMTYCSRGGRESQNVDPHPRRNFHPQKRLSCYNVASSCSSIINTRPRDL